MTERPPDEDGPTKPLGADASLYDALAPIYDEWQASNGMRPFALLALAKVLPELEREAGGGALAFADLGCGTGTLLDALAAVHPSWRLCGVDGSRGMLAEARRKPHGSAVAWVHARIADPLPFSGPRFDAVGCFYDTLNHLPDSAALARALATAADLVRPGGLVIFDVTNRLGFDRWWRGRMDFRTSRWHLTLDAHFEAAAGRATTDVRLDSSGGTRRFSMVQRLWDEPDLRRALAGGGLNIEHAEPWSPFEREGPGKTWWVTRRKR
jgi:SAM-dependent methyltransferase